MRRLAHLCRMRRDEIRRLRSKKSGGLGKRFFYCRKCLYLDPVDVTAPYWKAQWLFESENPWLRHPDSGSWATPGRLRNHPNMRRLLRFIRRKRYRTQWLPERPGFMYRGSHCSLNSTGAARRFPQGLVNFCPANLDELNITVRNKLKNAQQRPSIIAACWVQAGLW